MSAIDELIEEILNDCLSTASGLPCALLSPRKVDEKLRAALPEIRKEWLAEETQGRSVVPVQCPACSVGVYMFLGELLTAVSPELTEAIQREAFEAGVNIDGQLWEYDDCKDILDGAFAAYLEETK